MMKASSTEGWVKKGGRNQRGVGMAGPSGVSRKRTASRGSFSPVGIEGREKGPWGTHKMGGPTGASPKRTTTKVVISDFYSQCQGNDQCHDQDETPG